MQLLLKHKLLIGFATLVAAASAGGAYAATQSTGNSRQAYLNDVAKRLNVTPAQLGSAMKAAALDRLNAAVKAGMLTQAQADRLKQRIERAGGLPLFFGARAARRFEWRGRAPDGPPGPGVPGPGGPPGPGPLGPPGPAPGHGPFAAAAQYLGLSDAQLFAALRSGKTLAQIASAHKKSVSGLEQTMANTVRSRLDRLVASGIITRSQEQRALTRLSARIDRLVNRARVRAGAGAAAAGGSPGAAGGPPPPPAGGPALTVPPSAGPPPVA